MPVSRNPNHPKKGQRITVDPIRDLKDLQAISSLLADNPRDHLLFTMGINNGLRTGDLLKLRVNQVDHLRVGDTLSIRESKTGKVNFLVVNKAVFKSLRQYLDAAKPHPESFLFRSRKGTGPITIQTVNHLLKNWTSLINIKGRYGAHSLRKTWGYMQRTMYGVGFEIIAKRYNHSNPAVTMRYLGIEDKEVHGILLNEIG
jgi:integrase